MKQEISIPYFRRILRALENEIVRTLSEETDCCGVTVAQCHLLLETENAGTANLGELAAALELDKSTLSRTVDSLCQIGLVDRREDPVNRRKIAIQLSGEGKKKADEINSLCNNAYARIFSYIPQDKQAGVLEAVALLSGAMKKSRKEKTEPCCNPT